jgi:hypothetical protein
MHVLFNRRICDRLQQYHASWRGKLKFAFHQQYIWIAFQITISNKAPCTMFGERQFCICHASLESVRYSLPCHQKKTLTRDMEKSPFSDSHCTSCTCTVAHMLSLDLTVASTQKTPNPNSIWGPTATIRTTTWLCHRAPNRHHPPSPPPAWKAFRFNKACVFSMYCFKEGKN